MKILAIDPGNKKSGYVKWSMVEGVSAILDAGVVDNDDLIGKIKAQQFDLVAIEWIQSMGMAVGASVFETCMWAGSFKQAAQDKGIRVRLIPRGQLKLHHCHMARAKDSNITQSLRDKYGEKGTKAEPGFFFGVASHAWQACAVAAYVAEDGDSEKEIVFE